MRFPLPNVRYKSKHERISKQYSEYLNMYLHRRNDRFIVDHDGVGRQSKGYERRADTHDNANSTIRKEITFLDTRRSNGGICDP
jgi:hypothetical protein